METKAFSRLKSSPYTKPIYRATTVSQAKGVLIVETIWLIEPVFERFIKVVHASRLWPLRSVDSSETSTATGIVRFIIHPCMRLLSVNMAAFSHNLQAGLPL